MTNRTLPQGYSAELPFQACAQNFTFGGRQALLGAETKDSHDELFASITVTLLNST
jgi:hypothetical protein